MKATSERNIAPRIASTPWGKKLYPDAAQFLADSANLHHAFIVYRTLKGEHGHIFQPDSVFYVGRSPAAYIKSVDRLSNGDIQKWQHFLWNQAVVPMLIIRLPKQIRVYTAYTAPLQLEENADQLDRLEYLLGTTADALELDKLLTSIEAGTIYEEKPAIFRRDKAVHRYLLDNLNHAATKLAETIKGEDKQENLRFIHTFLTRLLFVCYLVERGMIKGDHFKDNRLSKFHKRTATKDGYFLRHLFTDMDSDAKKCDILYKLFRHVKERFNGSLFPDNLAKEKQLISKSEGFIGHVDDFLQGRDTGSGQLSLDFWAYDFSVIPIELISGVYEGFLGAQGEIRSSGAYYTPPHLAELTVDIALEKIDKPVHTLKALDPACGSGIFLVSLFNRMAQSLRIHEKLDSRRRVNRAQALFDLLRHLYGIDVNKTACHITCFSLYLAVLEQLSPIDVEELHAEHKKLPGLLHGHKCSSTNYETIIRGNLFDRHLPLDVDDFGLIIGNPPWVSGEKQKDEPFLAWRKKGKPNILAPDKQIAHGFMWEVPKYLSDSGRVCLLLPAAVLFNIHTNAFQYEWFKTHSVERVVNLSDLRQVLFADAIHPCVAIRFTAAEPADESSIQYESPKTDVRSQQGGPVYIREEDTSSVQLRELLSAASQKQASVIWKSRFRGSWRDQRLLSRLSGLPKLADYAGEPIKKKRWLKGVGCQPYSSTDEERKREKIEPWWDKSTRFFSPKKFSALIATQKDYVSIPDNFGTLRRSPHSELFLGPKVLLTKGSRQAIYCEDNVIFRDTLTSITYQQETRNDKKLLFFLTAVLGSELVDYYLFHTSSHWYIERDQIMVNEFLSVPFFLPEDAPNPKSAKDIVDKVASSFESLIKEIKAGRWFGKEEQMSQLQKNVLEPLVRQYFDIDDHEAMVIDDTIQTIIPSSAPTEKPETIPPALQSARDEEYKQFTNTLCSMLKAFTREKKTPFVGKIFKGTPYSVVHVRIAKKDSKPEIVESPNKLHNILNRMEALLEHRDGNITFCQNLKVFDGDDLYILKPMQRRFWTRTAALNDADEIAGAIIMHKEGQG